MSYDIYFEGPAPQPCPTCGHVESVDESDDDSVGNPTYNLTPIFDLALTGEDLPNPEVPEPSVVLFRTKTDRPRGLRLLSGKTGRESLELLGAAMDRFADERMRERLIALEPENGWGNVDGAVKVIRKMRYLANKYPDRVWTIH